MLLAIGCTTFAQEDTAPVTSLERFIVTIDKKQIDEELKAFYANPDLTDKPPENVMRDEYTQIYAERLKFEMFTQGIIWLQAKDNPLTYYIESHTGRPVVDNMDVVISTPPQDNELVKLFMSQTAKCDVPVEYIIKNAFVIKVNPDSTSKDLQPLLGLLGEDAVLKIKEMGFNCCRVISLDGKGVAGTADYREDRVNIELTNGFVTSARIG